MCGIAGFWRRDTAHAADALTALAGRMGDALAHRGPDADGVWVDPACGLAFAHRRLSIIDLSPEGAQPMVSGGGRYVLAYNGEVYNFPQLRAELEADGVRFRGHSDTEVLLETIAVHGLRETVGRLNGMFAFALWDRNERTLSLVRDRMGIKPLYYGCVGGHLLFASELKALRQFPDWNAAIDREALSLFMRHGYIPAPWSIYQNIRKLAPGTCVTFDETALSENAMPVPETYWSARESVEQGQGGLFAGSIEESADALESLLSEAVRKRMIADVPLGAFLSGGIDSSLVVALMQKYATAPVKTFTIAFGEEQFNEAPYARAVAEHLGTDHTEWRVTPEEARAVIPDLPQLYDEPFADVSQIPTFCLSRLTRQHVTVALSGDGGDELFGGYPRYKLGRAIWRNIGWMPLRLRKLVGRLISAVPLTGWDTLFRGLRPVLPGLLKHRSAGDIIARLAEVIAAKHADAVYAPLVSLWKTGNPLAGGGATPDLLADLLSQTCLRDFTRRMMFLDTATYLPGDILAKVDRASMGVGLEVRVPVLDPDVFAFAARLPLAHLVGKRGGKRVLRRVLYRHVPPALIDRPKKGFGVPLAAWLRGPLKEWAGDMLSDAALKNDDYLDSAIVQAHWRDHLAGKADWKYELWNVLMYRAWAAGCTGSIPNEAL